MTSKEVSRRFKLLDVEEFETGDRRELSSRDSMLEVSYGACPKPLLYGNQSSNTQANNKANTINLSISRMTTRSIKLAFICFSDNAYNKLNVKYDIPSSLLTESLSLLGGQGRAGFIELFSTLVRLPSPEKAFTQGVLLARISFHL